MPDTPIPYRRTLLLDAKGDLQFSGSGKLVFTSTDAEKREQDIRIYMKTVYGEDMFNDSYGFDIIAAKEAPFSAARIEHELRKTIKQYQNREDRPNRIREINSIIVGTPSAYRAVEVSVNLTADTNTISTLQTNI